MTGSSFSGDLDALLKGVMHRLEAQAREITLVQVNERLGQLMRQNEHLAGAVDQITSARSLVPEVDVQIRRGLRDFFSGLGDSPAVELHQFRECQIVFDTMTAAFESLNGPLLEIERTIEQPKSYFDIADVTSLDLKAAVDAAVAIKLILVFRRSLARVLDSGRARSVEEDALEVCRAFDVVIRVLTEHDVFDQFARFPVDWPRRKHDRVRSPRDLGDALVQMGERVFLSVRGEIERMREMA